MSRILGLCGSLRAGSSNLALLQALAQAAGDAHQVQLYEALGGLPHFNPDLDGEGAAPPAAVAELRARVAQADAVVISSPEYAHGIPGSMKNALDWLVSCGELAGKPVALLNASAAGGDHAQRALAEVLRTMSWELVEAASRTEPFLKRKLTPGQPLAPELVAELRACLDALARAAQR